MAIFFNGRGKIRVKKEVAQDFINDFNKLFKDYDLGDEVSYNEISYNENGVLEFRNYARHFFIRDCAQLIDRNIDKIIEGKLWFICDDEDGSCDRPFPYIMQFEIVDEKLYEDTIETRLPYDWEYQMDKL